MCGIASAASASASVSAKYLEHAKAAEELPKYAMTEKQLELQPRRHQLSPDSVTGETIFGDISRPLRGQMENCLHSVRRDCWPECASCRWRLMEDLNAPELCREGGGTLLKSCQANDRRQLDATKGWRRRELRKCHKLILSIK